MDKFHWNLLKEGLKKSYEIFHNIGRPPAPSKVMEYIFLFILYMGSKKCLIEKKKKELPGGVK